MMLVGFYPFMLNTAAYETLRRTHGYRWQAQQRIGRKPAQQFLGPDAGQIKLDGVILPHWKGGHFQLDAMRALAATGKPQFVISGSGRVFGKWVIKQVDETGTEFFADGSPREIKFSMSLAEYGPDQGGFGALSFGVAAVSTVARLL